MHANQVDVERYRRDGFAVGFRAVPTNECATLLSLFTRLRGLLPPGKSTQRMDWWHALDRELWDLATLPVILDRVETILGPDFYLWGSQFFAKDPGDPRTTPWHQDAYYWPLTPHRAATVWLAFTDTDAENGAMRVIPGSHTWGPIHHQASQRGTDVLEREAEGASDLEGRAVTLCLRAGEFSLHDDNILHGSGPNPSQRLRCGLTLRYSAGEVKCDLNVWPFFRAFWVRGMDRWGHNPVGTPPTGPMTQYHPVTPD